MNNTFLRVTDYIEEDINEMQNTAREIWPGMPEAKPFPFHLLPVKMQEYIHRLDECKGCPKEFTATAMLWVIGTATGNTYSILDNDDEPRKAILYVGIAASSNLNKSGSLKAAKKPLQIREQQYKKAYDLEMSQYKRIEAMTKTDRKKQNIEIPPRPVLKKYIVQDFTPEALLGALNDNPRGLGVFRDELAGMFADFGRYNKSGEEQFWLSNWSGDTLKVDRVSKDPLVIFNPSIGVIGSIQTEEIETNFKNRVTNGLLPRFIWAIVKREKPDWKPDKIDPSLTDEYARAINRILDLEPSPNGESNNIRFSSEAWQIIINYFNKHNKPRCIAAEETHGSIHATMYGKFDEICLRLTLILHLCRWAYGTSPAPALEIDPETAQMAIELNEFYISQSERVYYHLTASPADMLKEEQKELYQALPEEFTTTEAHKIREKLGKPSISTLKRMLRDRKLFTKQKHGNYKKI